jgi:hypothetical protein
MAILAIGLLPATASRGADLRVGAAAVALEADASMVVAGGIGPAKAAGQEGELRATAVVMDIGGGQKAAIVSCDVLFVAADFVDRALARIEKTTGLPPAAVMVTATHTHHAPSTTAIHGYDRDGVFTKRLEDAIVQAVERAHAKLPGGAAELIFRLGEEKTVGANSRLLLKDGTIYWTGRGLDEVVRPTGPFDPQLPVLAFREASGRPQRDNKLRAALFNHSTHTIGTRKPGVRSPSFYGLAAQELEAELGGVFCFVEGASGSTHNIPAVTGVSADQAVVRMKAAVKEALLQAQPVPVTRFRSVKKPFTFKVRTFEEAAEDEKVASYCKKRLGGSAEYTIGVFRAMRRQLAAEQGKERTTTIQAVVLGDVAIVGVPAEYFTVLGIDIKKRSPFKHTVIAELANDWIGYLPDREAHRLGGYQTWTGLHSYAEIGTGERMADEAVALLKELAK